MAFPSVYEAVPGLIETDRIVLVTGRIDLRGRELQIRANEVREPDLGLGMTPSVGPENLVVDLQAAACTPGGAREAEGGLRGASGRAPVRVRFLSSAGVTPLEVGSLPRGAAGRPR